MLVTEATASTVAGIEAQAKSERPTPAQTLAAEPRRSVWVTANAGTGKTRVLTNRVLRLLLDGADPESILCITFTRAAASEMAARVEKQLAEWAVAPDASGLAADLEQLTGEPLQQHLFSTAPDGCSPRSSICRAASGS